MPAIKYSMVSSWLVCPITSASMAKQLLSKAAACTPTSQGSVSKGCIVDILQTASCVCCTVAVPAALCGSVMQWMAVKTAGMAQTEGLVGFLHDGFTWPSLLRHVAPHVSSLRCTVPWNDY